MKVNGIVAEYNPFHNGHRYQLLESRRLTGADYTVIVLTGNFVQRGSPALLDKYTRAEMALLNGADLVLELPTIYSASSAEYFASGAVSLLDRLGVVTHLCFGSECGEISPLHHIASFLLDEPENYVTELRALLREGYSYPNARNSALAQCSAVVAANRELLSSPNNILGIEYIKAILRTKSAMEPVTVRRLGRDYRDPVPSAEKYCSALSIRQALSDGRSIESVSYYMPDSACRLLEEHLVCGRGISSNDFSSSLYYKLLSEKESGFSKYLDVSEDLSDRICNRISEYKNFDDFCNLLKTKEMTYTRISRCLLHILLGITKEDMEICRELDYTPYARVLGFRKDSSALLTAIKEHSSIPFITKLADAEKLLSEEAWPMLKQDIQISQLYNGVIAGLENKTPCNEYTRPLVIIG